MFINEGKVLDMRLARMLSTPGSRDTSQNWTWFSPTMTAYNSTCNEVAHSSVQSTLRFSVQVTGFRAFTLTRGLLLELATTLSCNLGFVDFQDVQGSL